MTKPQIPETQSLSRMFNTTLTAVVVIALVLLIIVALNSNSQPPANQGGLPDTIQQQGTSDLIEVSNLSQIKLENKQFILPTGWEIAVAFSSTNGSGYKCLGSDCTLYLISNPSTKLGSVAVSLPQAVVSQTNSGNSISRTKAKFLGSEIDLNQISGTLYEQDFEVGVEPDPNFTPVETGKIPLEVYGCQSGVCVNAMFSSDADTNKLQVEEFKKFLDDAKLK